MSAFDWLPDLGIEFILVNRKSGEFIGTFKGEKGFCLHHVNAFEETGEDGKIVVHVDMMMYPEPFYDALDLAALRSGYINHQNGVIKRYSIHLSDGAVTVKDLSKSMVREQ